MNKKTGISLIVLVITIILIIILAVAVILTLSNNNPIDNAKTAVSDNDEAALKEEATLLYADWFTKKNLGTLEEEYKDKSADDYVKDKLQGNYGELKNRLTVSNEGKISLIDKDLADLQIKEGVVIPRGFEYKEGTVSEGLVIKKSTSNLEFVWVPVEEGTFVAEELVEKEGYET